MLRHAVLPIRGSIGAEPLRFYAKRGLGSMGLLAYAYGDLAGTRYRWGLGRSMAAELV